jgi:hypothetical protein
LVFLVYFFRFAKKKDLAQFFVKKWYDEINNYDFKNSGHLIRGKESISHFVTMIWASSLRLGCGISQAANNSIYAVCYYNPRGNVFTMGQVTNIYKNNVLPLKEIVPIVKSSYKKWQKKKRCKSESKIIT